MPIKFFDPYGDKDKVMWEILTTDFYRPLYRKWFWYKEGREISFFCSFQSVYLESRNKYPELINLSSEDLRAVVLRLIREKGISGGSMEVSSLWDKLVLTMKGANGLEETRMSIIYQAYFQKISWYLIKDNIHEFRNIKEKMDWEEFLR